MHSSQNEKWQSMQGVLWRPLFSKEIDNNVKNERKSGKNKISGCFFSANRRII
jgi:hypothetical protein